MQLYSRTYLSSRPAARSPIVSRATVIRASKCCESLSQEAEFVRKSVQLTIASTLVHTMMVGRAHAEEERALKPRRHHQRMDGRVTVANHESKAQGQQMFTLAAEIKPKEETLSLKVGGVEVIPYLAGSAAIGTIVLVTRAMFGGSKSAPQAGLATKVISPEEFERLILSAYVAKGIKSLTPPSWWNPPPRSSASESVKEAKKAEAEFLLSKIEQQKKLGLVYGLEDIIKLRGVCQESGAAVKPKTAEERDAIFKTAVEAAVIYAQDQTDMAGEAALLASFDGGEKPETRFITGLASDLGLENERAVLITQGVVAAAARARLIDAVKNLKESNEMDALVALIKLSNLVQHIPVLQANGPEPELIASSLKNASTVEERKKILYLLGQLYIEAAGVWTSMLGFRQATAAVDVKEKVAVKV